MNILDLIHNKRSGSELTEKDIYWLVESAVAGVTADYQLSALLMAICYEGLTFSETSAMTRAFVASGSQFKWHELPGPVVDKHSTGGVGDKVSLLLAPWLAEAGCYMPKMSGRGLGHTGGTIDKLESIPGFNVELSEAEFRRQVLECGCAIVAQSAALVPADKLFYSLRDATGTVRESGLIAASVMSKKIAGGADIIVLDVKYGSGAFFAEAGEAELFGRLAAKIGEHNNRKVSFVLSAMDQPLGRMVGNGLEVGEALKIAELREEASPVVSVCVELGTKLLVSAACCSNAVEATELMLTVLREGRLQSRLCDWIDRQGGDLAAFQSKLAEESARRAVPVSADSAGRIATIDALQIGRLAHRLGAGRAAVNSEIDHFAGVELCCRRGDEIQPGDELGVLYPGDSCEISGDALEVMLKSAIGLAQDRV